MKVPALIMAGGRGKRLGVPVEKPLLPFLGKPLIDWVVKAVSLTEKISEFYVVTSDNTPETEKRCISKSWRFIRTNAMGYHIDLRQAVREAGLSGPILTLPSDVPAVSGKFLDKVITAFEVCGKDFLAVFVPIEKRKALGLSISSTDEYDGKWYAVSGVNIVNGSKIQIDGKIETGALITEEMEVLLNINTPEDLKVSEKILESLKR